MSMASRSYLAALLLLALLGAAVTVRAEDVPDPDVTVLTESNFDSFIAADLSLVEFYAPWCGHCKSLQPEYALAATELKKQGVPLGKLDATVHARTAGAYGISGYPTLKVFRNGKATDYNGPRQADGIVAYMKKQVGPAARPIQTDAELQALMQTDPVVQYAVVAFVNEGKVSQLQSSFSLLAARLRDSFVFGRTTSEELKAQYGVPSGTEAIVTFLRGEKHVYEGGSKTADVEAFIREHSLPLVGEYSDTTAALYAARNLPVAKLFINVDRKPGSKNLLYYTNRLKKLAQQYKGQMLVSYADRTNQKMQLEHLNMLEEEHGFAIDNLAGQLYRYDPDEEEEVAAPAAAGAKKGAAAKGKKKGLDVEGWGHFIADYLAGDATPYTRTQRAPKNNLSLPVKIATGQNFDDLVNQPDKDVMIEFYAPWCGHCNALTPKYEKLGEKLLGEKDVVIAKLDATANDFDRKEWEVKGYPTIYFKAAGKKPVVYDGARETDAMLDYVKKNGKTIKKGKKKSKGKKSQ